jgi:hypothetical protein
VACCVAPARLRLNVNARRYSAEFVTPVDCPTSMR